MNRDTSNRAITIEERLNSLEYSMKSILKIIDDMTKQIDILSMRNSYNTPVTNFGYRMSRDYDDVLSAGDDVKSPYP